MSDTTLPSLLERLRCEPHDGDSWRRLVELYTGWLRGWLWRLARLPADGPDTEEILQSVFVVLFRELRDFRHNGRPGAFRAWLRRVLVNCLRDHQRKGRHFAGGDPGPLLDQLEDPHSDP